MSPLHKPTSFGYFCIFALPLFLFLLLSSQRSRFFFILKPSLLRLLLHTCAAPFPLFLVVFSTLSLLFYSKAIPPDTLVPIIPYFGLIDHFRGNFSPFETDKFLKQITAYQFGIFNRYRIRSLRPIFTEIIRVFFFDLQIIKTQISIDKPSILNEPSDCRFSISTNVKAHPFIGAWKFQIFVYMQIFDFYFIN